MLQQIFILIIMLIDCFVHKNSTDNQGYRHCLRCVLHTLSRGRGDRTPVYGFGERRTTAVLFPFILFINAKTLSLCTNRLYYTIRPLARQAEFFDFTSKILPDKSNRILHACHSRYADALRSFQCFRICRRKNTEGKAQLLCLLYTLFCHTHRAHLTA